MNNSYFSKNLRFTGRKLSGLGKRVSALFLVIAFTIMGTDVFAQTPGQIFQPAQGDGRLILNPSGSGFVSASTDGYSPENVDYGSANEIGYHPLPLLFEEVGGDQRTGGAHTDMFGVTDGSYGDAGAFVFNDGENMLFRIRLVDFSSAAKGYSFLFDTSMDGVPDWEITLKTGGGEAGVTIYDAAGDTVGSRLPLNERFHKALAGKHNVDGDPEKQTYYYDWYVNWSDMPFGPGDNFRAAALTITSATGSYLSDGTVADIGGVSDSDFPSEPTAVFTILDAMPTSSGGSLEEGGGFGNILTSRPTVFAPIFENDTSISGTSTEADGTTITLNIYNDAEVFQTSFTSAVSDNTWTVNNSGLSAALEAGYFVGAKANASGKDESNESTRREVFAVGEGGIAECTPAPSAFARSSQNAATGTVPGLSSGISSEDLIIRFYSVNEDGSVGDLTISTNTTEASSEDVALAEYEGSGQVAGFEQDSETGDVNFRLASQGSFPSGTSFYITAQLDGDCESDFSFDGDEVAVDAPVITTTQIEASTGSQTIEGTSTEADDTEIEVYRNDDDTIIGDTIVTGGTWSATISAVDEGDQVYARAISSENIRSGSSNIIIVGVDQSEAPTITMPSSGAYEEGATEITGFSAEDPGTEITIYSHPGEEVLGTGTVNAFGNWTVELDDPLSGGDQFKATANAFGKSESDFTDVVTVAGVDDIPDAPVINGGGDVTAGSSEINITSGSGTITLFADGTEIGSRSGTGNITVDPAEIMVGVVLTATATDNGFTSELSDPVGVIPAPPNSISMFSNPAKTVAGNTSQVVSTVEDEFGNVLEGIDLDFSILTGNGSFTGTSSGLSTNFLGQTSVDYETFTTIETATIGSELSSDSSINDETEITTIAGPATEISSISIASGTIQADGSTTVTVTVLDANNNLVPDVNVSFSSDDTDIATVTGTVETDENGEATATIDAEGQAGDVEITASINDSDDNVDSSDSESVPLTVTPVISADDSGVSVDPASVIANGVSSSTITINVRDIANDPVTGLNASAFNLTFNVGGSSSGTASFDNFGDADEENGNYTFTITNTEEETGDVIVEVSGTELDDKPEIVFTEPVADAANSSVSANPTEDITADGSEVSTISIQVRDGGNQPISGLDIGDFIFSGEGNGELDGFSEDGTTGNYTINLTNTTAETVDVSVEVDEVVLGSTGDITFVAGDLAELLITTQPEGGASGELLDPQPVIELRDSEGNVLTGDSSTEVTVSIESGTGGNLGGDLMVTADNGIVTFTNLTLSGLVSETYVLQFSDEEFDVNSEGITVTAGSAQNMAMDTEPGVTTAGENIAGAPAVIVTDGAGNPIQNVDVTVSVNQESFSSGTFTQTTNSDGIAEFDDLQITVAGTGYQLTFDADAAGVTDVTSGTFDVVPEDANYFVLTSQSGTEWTAGTENQITVTAYDEFDNVATGYEGSRDLIFGGAATINGNVPTADDVDFGDQTTIVFTNGEATNIDVVLKAAELAQLTAADGGITEDEALGITVSAAAAELLVLNPAQQSLTAGERQAFEVSREDAFGNEVTDGALTVSLSTPTDGTFHNADEAGDQITEVEIADGQSSETVWYKDTAATDTSYDITFNGGPGDLTQTAEIEEVSAAGAHKLVLTQQPTEVTSGVEFPEAQRPIVQLQDEFDNDVAEENVNITVSLDQGDGTLSGTTEISTNEDGEATFTDLSISGTAGSDYVLEFTSVGLEPVQTNEFEVITGLATPVIDTPEDGDFANIGNADDFPISGTAGGATEVEITVEDGDNNTLTFTLPVAGDGTFSGNIDISSGLDEGTLTITVIGKDAADNESDPADVDIVLDLTPPALTVNEKLTNNTTPTITGTSDQPEGTTVTLEIDEEEYTGTVDDQGEWSIDVTEELTPDGNFTAEVTIEDEAGNETTESATISIDTTPPAGYTVSWDTDPVNSGNEEAGAFTITDGEEDATFNYEITSSGGGTPVTGTGTITDPANQEITGLDLSGLEDGELTISVTLTDEAENEGGAQTDQTDKNTVAPRLASIDRFDPSEELTNANELTYRVTFSENVTGVTGADFAVSGVTGADISVDPVSGSQYDVTISGGDTADFDGTVSLSLDSPDISDSFGNELTNTDATGDVESYTLDNTSPQITSITLVGSPDSDDSSIQFQVVFNENVTGFNFDGFSLTQVSGNPTGNIASFTGEDDTYTITVDNLAGVGDLRLDFLHDNDDDIEDLAGNAIENDFIGGDTHSTSLPGAPASFSVANASVDQGQPLLMNFTDLEDSDNNTVSDGEYNIEVSDDLTGTGFTVENVFFTNGEATGVQILDGTGTAALSADEYENVTFTIGTGTDTADIDVNQALADGAGDEFTIEDLSVAQGTELVIAISDINDLAGDGFNGEATITFSDLDDIDGFSDPTREFTNVTITNGEAEITLFSDSETGGFAVQSGVMLTATIGDATETFNLNVTAVISANNSSVSADPSEVIANGVSTSTITIGVRDAADNPVTGLGEGDFELAFVTGSGESSTAGFDNFSDTGGGNYTFTVSNSAVETGEVVIEVNNTELDQQPQIVFTAQEAHAGNSTVSADPTTGITANGTDASVITIQVRDADNEPISGLTSTDFTFDDEGDGELGGFSEDGSTGNYTFNLTNTTAETVDVSVEVDGQALGNTGDITFVAGDLDQLVIITQPEGGASGAELATQPVIELRDSEGNLLTGDSSTEVTVSIQSGSGGAVGGNLWVTADNGIVTFTDLSLSGTVGENYVLRFTGGGEHVDSDNVSVTEGQVSKLAFTDQPQSVQAGDDIGPVRVQLQDANNNNIEQDEVSVTISISDGATLVGSVTADTDASGIAEFTSIYVVEPGADYTLTATSGTLDSDDSDNFTITRRAITITADAKSKTYGDDDPDLTFEISSGTLIAEADLTGDLDRDAGENAAAYAITQGTLTNANNVSYDITYVGAELTITARDLVLSNFSADSKTYDGTTAAGGVNFDDDRLGGDDLEFDYDADFSDADTGADKTVNITNITIISGDDQNNYALQTTSGSTTADITSKELTISGTFTADDKEYDGNTDATINDNSLSLDGVVGGETVSLDNIVIEFAASDAGEDITVSIASADLTGGDESNYTLNLSGAPTATANITRQTPVITEWPAATGITYGQNLAQSTLSGGTVQDGLQGTFTFADDQIIPGSAGTYQADIIFTPNDSDNYTPVTGTDVTDVEVGQKSLTITVNSASRAADEGNPAFSLSDFTADLAAGDSEADVTGGSVTFELASTDANSAPGIYEDEIGVDESSLNGAKAANYDITIESGDLEITPASLAGFDISGVSDPTVAGTSHTITVTARDTEGNIKTDYTGMVTFSSSDASADLPVDYTFTGGDEGVAIFTNGVTLKTAGEQWVQVEDATDDTRNGRQEDITVTHANADKIAVSAIPNQTVGVAFPVTFTIQDAYDNTVTDFEGDVNLSTEFGSVSPSTVTFVSSEQGEKKTGFTLFENGTAQKISGVSADDASVSGESNEFNVSTGPGAKLVITTQPEGGKSGELMVTQPVLEIQDIGGNLVASDSESEITVSVYSGENGTLSGTKTVTANAGVVTYTDLNLAGLVTEDYHFRFTSPGLIEANTYHFNGLTPGNLYGQDNWQQNTAAGGDQRNAVVFSDAHDETQWVRFSQSGANVRSVASRVNDNNFSFTKIDSSDTKAVFQADVRVGYWGIRVWTGYDLNEDGAIYGTGERGPGFFVRTNNSQASILTPNGNTTVSGNAKVGSGGWLRLKLEMDLTANNGEGAGTLYIQNLSSGDTEFEVVSGLENVNLGLDRSASDVRNFTLWNGVDYHMEGATHGLNNVKLGKEANLLSDPVNVTAGVPDQMAIQTQPGESTAGENITGAPAVIVTDGAGNPAENVEVTVSVNKESFSVGTITQTTDANGIATFGDLQITVADTGYELEFNADAAGVANVTSDVFDVTPAAISIAPNGSLLSGTDLERVADGAEQATISVQLRDEYGNDISQAGVDVDFATDFGTLSSTTQPTDTNGLATVTLTSATTGTTDVTATVDGIGAVNNGSPVQVIFTHGALDNFLVETEGGGAIGEQTAGESFNIRITARDAHNHTVTGFTGTAELTSTGNLTGSPVTTAAFTDGVLASQAVTITNKGNFTITATSGVISGESDSFTVSSGDFAQMAFTTQPTGEPAGDNIGPIVLQMQDGEGNAVETEGVSVILSISDGATLAGTLTQTTNASGVVEFTDLYVIEPGEDYIITAASDAITRDADAITITRRAITITADANQTKTYGEDDPAFDYTLTNGTLIPGVDLDGELSRDIGENAGDYAITQGTLTNTENSSYDITFASDDFTITARDLTLTNFVVDDKTFDGTTDYTGDIEFDDDRVDGDDLEFNFDVVYSSANAGTVNVEISNITISGGTDQNNYNLVTTETTETATINQATPVVTSWPAATAIVYGETLTESSLSGGDTDVSGTFTFADAAIQPGSAGDFDADLIFTPDDKDNYETVIGTDVTTVTVTAKELTVINAAALDKVYDGNTDAVIEDAELSGIVGSDDVTLTNAASGEFDQVGVGTAINVTTNFVLTGTDAGNYTITQPTGLSADITPAQLTVINAEAQSKVYDTNDEAEITGAQLGGLVAGDDVNLDDANTGTFDSSNVGTGITVTTSMSISGADAGNYELTQPTGLTADITPAQLTVSGAEAIDKIYDGNTDAEIQNATLDGVIGSDDVVLTNTTAGEFAQSDVGTGIAVSTNFGLDGDQAGNYQLTQPAGLTADITQAALTITVNDASRQAGAADPAFSFEDFSGALAGSDDIADVTGGTGAAGDVDYTLETTDVNSSTGEYTDEIGIDPSSLDGSKAANYDISIVRGTLTITPAALAYFTVTGIDDPTTAGESNSVTITAFDTEDNIKTDYTGTITFSSSDTEADLPSDYTFTAGDEGVVTLSDAVILKTAGDQWVEAADGDETGRQEDITVVPATVFADNSNVSADPTTLEAGENSTITVTLEDEFNNPISGVTDFDTDLGGATVVTAISETGTPGTYELEISNNTAETNTIDVTANSMAVGSVDVTFTSGAISASESAVTVNPDELVVGNNSTVTITLRDSNENLIGNVQEGEFSLNLSGDAEVVAGTFDETSTGVYTFEVTNETAEEITVTATVSSTQLDTEPTIEFTVGAVFADNSTVSADPTSLEAGENSTITVTLEDEFNNPVSGVTDFVVDLGGATEITAISETGTPGTYELVVSNTTAETNAIEVTANSVAVGSVDVTFTSGAISASESGVSVEPATLVVGNNSTVTITLRDSNENLISGLAEGEFDLSLTGDAEVVAGTFDETSTGVYTFEVTNETAEEITVTATVSSTQLDTEPTIEFTVGAVFADNSTVSADPTSLEAGENSTITVTLEDEFNNPISGATDFDIDLGGATEVTAISETGTPGTYELVISNTTAETNTIEVTANSVAVGSVDVTFTSGAISASESGVSVDPATLVVGNNSTVTITLRDSNENLIGGLAEGEFDLSLTGDAEVVAGTFDETSSGVYTFEVTNETAEEITVTATVSGTQLDEESTVEFTVGAVFADNSSVSADPTTLEAGENSTITVTLEDEFNNPVSGVTDFVVDLGGATEVTAISETGTPGTYELEISNNTAETNTIDVTANSVAIGSVDVTFTSGAISAIESGVSVDPATLVVGNNSTVTITLRDSNENLIGGLAEGEFSLSLTGNAEVVAGTFDETSTGVYELQITNETAEEITVTATVSGTQLDDESTVEFTVGAVFADNSTVTADPTTLEAGENSTITVTLEDEFNNPISGVIDFDIDLGGATEVTAISETGTPGTYELVISNTTAETNTIDVTANSVSVGSVDVTFTSSSVFADNSSVSADPTTLEAGENSTITVTLEDEFNNPVSGVTDFVVDLGGATEVTAISETGTPGTYELVISNTTAETNTIEVTANSVAVGSVDVTFTSSSVFADNSTVTADPTTLEAGENSTITVTLEDEFNNPISGVTDFVINLGGATEVTAISETGSPGTYELEISNNTAETNTIDVTANSVSVGSVVVTFTSGSISITNSSVTAAPDVVIANGEDQSQITIVLRDENDNDITGISESDFSFSVGTNAVISEFTEQGTGEYTALMSNTELETVAVEVNVSGITLTDQPVVEFTFGPAAQLFVSTQPIGDISGELLDVQPVIEVQDESGHLVADDNSTEVTVSIFSGDDGELDGTLTLRADNGVVSYTDLILAGITGEEYVLRFTADDGDVDPVNSDPVTVIEVCDDEDPIISGRVIDVDTDTPQENVMILLIPQNDTPGPTLMFITDDQGEFIFEDVPTGDYLVQVQDENLNIVRNLYPIDSSLLFLDGLETCDVIEHDFEYGESDRPVLAGFVWLDVTGTGEQDEWFDADGDGEVTENITDENGVINFDEWEWIDLNGSGTWDQPEDLGELNRGGFGNDQSANIIIEGPDGYYNEVIIGLQGNWRTRPDQENPWGEYVVQLVPDDPFLAEAERIAGTGLVKPLTDASNNSGLKMAYGNQNQDNSALFVCDTSGLTITAELSEEEQFITDLDFALRCFSIIVQSVELPDGVVGESTTVEILLTDESGNPVSGLGSELAIEIAEGANQEIAFSEIVDEGEGIYRAYYLPETAGEDQVAIILGGKDVPGSPFTTVVTELIPESISAVKGDGQQGTVASTLEEQLVVEVMNQNDQPLEGVEVEFTLIGSPDGAQGQQIEQAESLKGAAADQSGVSVITNSDGRAGISLTLGSVAGEYLVQASINGLDPVILTALATPGSVANFVITGGNEQEQRTLTVLSDSLEVNVSDQFGNPVSGEPIAFRLFNFPESATGFEFMPADTVYSDNNGFASVAFRLGDTAGEYSVSARAFKQAAIDSLVFDFDATESRPDPSIIDTVNTVVFNGITDTFMYAEPSASLDGLSSFSAELWVLPKELTDYYELFAKNQEGEEQFIIWGEQNSIHVIVHLEDGTEVYLSADDIFSEAELPKEKNGKTVSVDNEGGTIYNWLHLALSVNEQQNRAELYRNGFRVAETEFNGTVNSGNGRLEMGRSFDGEIHEVRIWDYAISRNQAQSRMTQILTGSENGLSLYHTFDDEGDVAADLTVNGNDFFLENGVQRSFSVLGVPDIVMYENETFIMTFKGLDDFGGELTAFILELPEHGRLFQVTNNGEDFGDEITSVPAVLNDSENRAIYQPNQDFTGSDQLEFALQDMHGNQATAIRNITVLPLYRAPTQFEQISPANGEVFSFRKPVQEIGSTNNSSSDKRSDDHKITFKWESSQAFQDNSVQYRLRIWSDGGFEKDISSISDTTYTLHVDESLLSVDDQLFWQVEATDGIAVTQSASLFNFSVDNEVPMVYSLRQNYPNPFNPSTTIEYRLPVNSTVRIQIYDMLGRRVQTLVDGEELAAGIHTVIWDASNLASGVYFYRLEALGENGSRFQKTKQMTLIK